MSFISTIGSALSSAGSSIGNAAMSMLPKEVPLGKSDFATMDTGAKFGSLDFGAPSFSGAPTEVPEFTMPTGKTDEGAWKNPDDLSNVFEDSGNKKAWADAADAVAEGLKNIQLGDEGGSSFTGGHRPGFRGAQIPAGQYNQAALGNEMAAKEWGNASQGGQLEIPNLGSSDLTSLLRKVR